MARASDDDVELWWVSDGIESFAKIKGDDDNKLIGSEKVGDGMHDGDESSCSWTRWTKGKLRRGAG